MWFSKREAAGSVERRQRYQPTAVYRLAESLKERGIDLARRTGPWQVAARALQRPGRNGLAVIPIVTNGLAEVMAVGYGQSTYRDAIAFVILVLILLVKPTGIMGKGMVEKV